MKGSPRSASVSLSSQVHIASQCEAGGLRLASEGARIPEVPPNGEAATSPVLPAGPGPEAPVPAKHGSSPGRPRDPNTCFFEGQQRPHGARWAPNYDPLCSLCTCQVGCLGMIQLATGSGARGPAHRQSLGPSLQRRTVICDPVVCSPPSCPHPVQALDQCCPVCPGECPTGEEW